MKRRSSTDSSWEEDINKIVGLGSKSMRKSYYPELKEKIASLDRQKVFYQSVLNSIPDSVVITDPNGVIVQINPAMTRFFGYLATEVEGKHFSILFTNHQIDLSENAIWKENLQSYQCKDGSVLIGETLNSDIHDKNDTLLGHLQVIRDVTDRLEVLKQQKKLEEQLMKSQKMEAIGSMAGGIAHDFNNILSGIIGYAELVELFEMNEIDEIRQNLREILNASYRARDLVKQILTFSRRGNHELAPTRLTRITQEALKLIKASLSKNIELKASFETSADTVLADSTQIHQVITNLCTNSIHAMKETGGTLRLRIAEVASKSLLVKPYNTSFPDVMLLLEISDNGCGISADVIDHIFEPYFTTKQPGEGTGFGLALVHGIVKSHGGFIEVESTLGKGSCFRIFLPKQSKNKLQQMNVEEPSLPTGQGNVMLVDDEVPQLKWGKEFLVRLGYTVSTFDSGLEALGQFQKHPDNFDVIITDQTMPAITGLELSMKVRSIRPDIPIILCTGFSHAISLEKINVAGIAKTMNKPYSLAEMADVLLQVLN